MDTFQELKSAVRSDANIADNSSLFPDPTVEDAVNRAYTKCYSLFRWPGTEDAKKTSTQEDQEYYDYPQGWRDDSIWRLEVDGDQYGEDPDGSPMKFEDYLIWRADDDNANSTEKKWANQKRRYFIYPVPTSAGDYNISVWGQKNPDKLEENGDTTIFSYSRPECNEAVVLEAVAILKSKGEKEKSGEFRSAEAKQILIVSWTKTKQEQSKYEKDQPFFYVEDLFGKRNTKDTNIGNF